MIVIDHTGRLEYRTYPLTTFGFGSPLSFYVLAWLREPLLKDELSKLRVQTEEDEEYSTFSIKWKFDKMENFLKKLSNL